MAQPSALDFDKPQHFILDTSRRRWTCNICVPRRKNKLHFPNIKAALWHEQTSSEHARHISKTDWWKPQDEYSWDLPDQPPLTSEGLRTWEMQTHVDHVYDLVPFWIRGVDAAERGEVLRLEEFLQKMEGGGGWRTSDEVWGMLGAWKPNHQGESDGWEHRDESAHKAADTFSTSDDQDEGWGVKQGWPELRNHSSNSSHQGTERAKGIQNSHKSSHVGVTHPFVDDIALQEAADEGKRQRMYRFFEMPTEQKVLKIQETIRYLRTHPA